MVMVKVSTEERLRRPQVDRLSDASNCLTHRKRQAPVYESNVLLVSVGPHVPVRTLDQLTRNAARQRVVARVRRDGRWPTKNVKDVLLAVGGKITGKGDIAEGYIWLLDELQIP